MKTERRFATVLIICIFLAVAILMAGCGGIPGEAASPANPAGKPHNDVTGRDIGDTEPADEGNSPEKADPAAVRANETGKVMILMYHVIGASAEKPWMQTTANFRRDLDLLYEQGYSLISLNDFILNEIKTPAGRTPVILTFDDATAGHFRYLAGEDGGKEIDPECAVAILLEFGEKHPEFGHTATFYINDRPFGQSEYWQEKLAALVELGFDIGNHTLTHPKLNKLSDGEVQRELAGISRLVGETVPGYRVTSLALPYGLSPLKTDLAGRGSFNALEYVHEAVLKVGANPAKSPIAVGFNPYALPRVQASSEELGKWLEYFRKNPDERYISDGNPSSIAVPREKGDLVDKNRIKDKDLIFWD